MKYNPELEEEPEVRQAVAHAGYVSDNTAFMRWSTEVEEEKTLSNADYITRHRHRLMSLNKFPALAFYTDQRQLLLRKLRNIGITLCKNAGLEETAEETALDNIDDAQMTRGWQGNYSKVLITQRHELKEERIEEKAGRFSGLFGKKKEEEQQTTNDVGPVRVR